MMATVQWRGAGEGYRAEVVRRCEERDPSDWPGDPTVWIKDKNRARPVRLSKVIQAGGAFARLLCDFVREKAEGTYEWE